ncbi:MAG: hypothetical protein WAL37_01390, partial [Xanthobacteraceae bacterium]
AGKWIEIDGRFGSEVDIGGVICHVRFSPETGYWNLSRKMSALCQNRKSPRWRHIRFVSHVAA